MYEYGVARLAVTALYVMHVLGTGRKDRLVAELS